MGDSLQMLELLRESDLAFPMALTLRACAASLVLFLAAGVPLAWYCARRNGPAARVLMFVSTLPLVFPPVALGYLLLLLLGRSGPLGEPLYSLFGLRLVFTPLGVYLAAFIAGLPLVLRPLKVALESPALRNLEACALTCGVRPVKVFFLVTLPLIRSSLAASLLLGTARASGEVGITMMLGGNIEQKTSTLSLEIFNAVGRGDFDAATALCLVLGAMALAIYALLELVRGRQAL
ncbi:ABC transporter permease subunit [Mesosutterella sp. AGMB02718]|uniref:ABC transporter permease subunit n=1 Tax=Mesosutterella faecium TaxID=2925194 RepID=A0ABT7ING0_9BURK|nr:ABC transporter permease subunit [Mesosutterella sp. AGMB02718]MDL2059917.1 ABC transporter permease subunit [Mesosutterella sp. AGMB02718]